MSPLLNCAVSECQGFCCRSLCLPGTEPWAGSRCTVQAEGQHDSLLSPLKVHCQENMWALHQWRGIVWSKLIACPELQSELDLTYERTLTLGQPTAYSSAPETTFPIASWILTYSLGILYFSFIYSKDVKFLSWGIDFHFMASSFVFIFFSKSILFCLPTLFQN